jgi:hypothetical protein
VAIFASPGNVPGVNKEGVAMPRITDETVLREMVLDAFKHPIGQVIVARTNKYPTNLCKQLALRGVDKGKVCRVVNQLVWEGVLVADQTHVYGYGSGTDPIPLRATRYDLASRLTPV